MYLQEDPGVTRPRDVTDQSKSMPGRKKYVPVVGPNLRKLLVGIFALFAILVVNSVYLVSIRILGHATGES